ncbi:MAG TPA: A24 family peptidase [Pirellulaceae bacterium]
MDDMLLAFSRMAEPVRLGCILILGFVLAAGMNAMTYALAWNCRAIGPWLRADGEAPARRIWDFVPILGWWGLRRESSIHGRGYWIRPLLVDLLTPLGLVALYLWELRGGLLDARGIEPLLVHQQFVRHAVLLCLMLVATLIDLDEKTIPDSITIPGMLWGLFFAAFWPQSGLPVLMGPLDLSSPAKWPAALDGVAGWLVGCGSLWFWCMAMVLPRRLWLKGGFVKALRYLIARIFRYSYWHWIAFAGVAGTLGIHFVWRASGPRWQALLSSLVGMLFGMVLVWTVRIIASRALRKEALGFGDVTLMAMLGAHLGWQPTLLVFFIAPFAGAVMAIAQWLVTREHEIAYGPYLCLGALIVLLAWPALWDRWGLLFALGGWIPMILVVCLVLMALMLVGWRRLSGGRTT